LKDDEARVHRRLAAELFNRVWSLLEQPDRNRAADDTMLHAAHASRYHWGEVGTTVNLARGEWQVSRVYAVLGRAEPAMHHARRCLEICEAHDIGDFDLAFAYEALARASAVAGLAAERDRYTALARGAGERIAKEDDRAIFFGDLATLPTMTDGAG
jgi:hypothetical protein